MTNFGGIKPSMNIINRFWNTVLIFCSSTERQAILSTPLDFQDAQKGVISNCAKEKKLVTRCAEGILTGVKWLLYV